MYRVIKSKINMSLFGILASSLSMILSALSSGRDHIVSSSIYIYISDWESFEHSTAFANSEDYNAFMASMGHVFDLDKAAPLTSMSPPGHASKQCS